MAIVLGFVLAFIFSPIYNFLFKKTKSPNTSATLLTIFLIFVIAVPLWFFTPAILKQSFKIYEYAQAIDFVSLLQKLVPSMFGSDQFSIEIGNMVHSFVIKTLNSFATSLGNIILDFPSLALKFVVVLFTFFFVLRDGDSLVNYLKSLLPYDKDVKDKFFKTSREITKSVIYGHIVIGTAEGIVMGLGFFLFSVPNSLILTLLTILAGILPIVGPMLIWFPIMIVLLIDGNNFAAIGVLLFGIVASNIDHILRPLFVSRYTQIHSAVILIGMIGGLFLFGILGLILGPLILEYLIIVLELYREREL